MGSSVASDVLVVGGGMPGLTAAAYLSRAGLRVLLCEKEKVTGGLVNSFEYKGFVFDAVIRAIENSGIALPMLRQLGIDVEFLPNPVSIGIGGSERTIDERPPRPARSLSELNWRRWDEGVETVGSPVRLPAVGFASSLRPSMPFPSPGAPLAS